MSDENRSAHWTFVLDEPTRILVVDDDPILREFASVYLSTPSTVIDTAGAGAEALALIERNAYDIVLLDIEMPGLDGFAVLEKIRSMPELRHMPVVMLTGHEDIGSIDRAYRIGASSFATKPVNWRQLSYHLRYVLRASRLERSGAPEHDLAGGADRGSPHEVVAFFESVARRAEHLARQVPEHDAAMTHALAEVRRAAADALTAHSAPPASGAPALDWNTPSLVSVPHALAS